MIEIRLARPEERTRIKQIWSLAFGESDAEIDDFFAKVPTAEVLVLLDGSEVFTMTALLPVSLCLLDGTHAKSAYVYALATHPDARGKGYGRFLLNYVDFYLKEQGADCVSIVPAEASLFPYFSTCGFSQHLSTRKVELLREMIAPVAAGHTVAHISPADYNAQREEMLAGTLHISYPDELAEYQQSLSLRGRGALLRLALGDTQALAAADYIDDDTVVVRELLAPVGQLAACAALLAEQMPARRYHLRTPPDGEGLAGSYLQAFALIKWYNADLFKVWGSEKRGYLGLGFD